MAPACRAATCALLAVALYVLLVLGIGSVVTYLSCRSPPAPATVSDGARGAPRSGFFAAVPIAYLVMVVAVQIIRPLFG